MKFIQRLCAALAVVLSSLAFATPPNTSATYPVSYEMGQGWVSHEFLETAQNRYFTFITWGGRSYCFEAAQGSDSSTQLNPALALFAAANEVTLLASNTDDASLEPSMLTGSRICWIDSGAGRTQRLARLTVPIGAGSGDVGFMRFRAYETTVTVPLDVSVLNNAYKTGRIDFLNTSGATVAASVTTTVVAGFVDPSCTTSGTIGTTGSTLPYSIPVNGFQSAYYSVNCPTGFDTGVTVLARIAVAAPSASLKVYARQFGYANTQPVASATGRTALPAVSTPPPNAQLSTIALN
jgi:hypothetical protein